MTTSTLDREIRARIEGFASNLSELVKAAAVESVRQALGGGASPARQPARARANTRLVVARAKPAKQGKRGKRTTEDVAEIGGKILAFVRSNAGCSVEQIREGLGLSKKEVGLPILRLRAEKKLKTTGQKRGTRYFAGGTGPKAPAQAKRASPTAAKKRKPMSAEQKAALLERLAKARAAKKAGAR